MCQSANLLRSALRLRCLWKCSMYLQNPQQVDVKIQRIASTLTRKTPHQIYRPLQREIQSHHPSLPANKDQQNPNYLRDLDQSHLHSTRTRSPSPDHPQKERKSPKQSTNGLNRGHQKGKGQGLGHQADAGDPELQTEANDLNQGGSRALVRGGGLDPARAGEEVSGVEL